MFLHIASIMHFFFISDNPTVPSSLFLLLIPRLPFSSLRLLCIFLALFVFASSQPL